MESSVLVDRYRKWVIQRGTELIRITENDLGNIECETAYAMGYVNFYEGDIIELRIDSIREGKTEFFLHFQLNNLDRAKELYIEMEDALKAMKEDKKVKILLSCTSALTTSYFSELLNKAAETLNLKYEFRAVSFDRLEREGKDNDFILLAPQVHYARKKVQEMFKNVIVLNIPAQTFGKYDTGAIIEMLNGELAELEEKRTPKVVRTQHFFETTKKILTIGYINEGNETNGTVIYRYYKNGNIEESGESVNKRISFETLSEVIEPLLEKYPEIEVIGLGLPGSIENGQVYLPDHPIHNQNIEQLIKEKYHRDVFAFNDANMIVTGIYWLEDRYKSLILYYLPNKCSIAGCGIVVNGHLISGKQHVAGEVKYTQRCLNLSESAEELIKTEKGTEELIVKTVIPMICTVGPEAVFIYSPLTPNMDEIKKEMTDIIAEHYLPNLVPLNDVREYMMTGTFLRCIWRMDDIKRRATGMIHNPLARWMSSGS